MAAKLQALREQRSKVAAEMRALVEKDGAFTADDQQKFDNAKGEIERIDTQVKAIEDVLKLEAEEAAAVGEIANRAGLSGDEAHAVRNLDKQMFAAWARDGRAGLNAEMARVQDSRLLILRNEMSTATGAQGGFVVAPEFARNLSEALRAYGGVREHATVIRTASGASMAMPTADATSEEGELVPENAAASDGDTAFGTASLATYKFSSKVVVLPYELLQDSSIDLEAYIRRLLEQRLARATARYFTTGTGTEQPRGLVTAAGVGKAGATGQTTKVTLDDLIDLEHSVDPAYRQQGACRWMFHDTTLRELKKLKDADNRPIWLPGIETNSPDTILGYGYTINQHMASMAANAKSILFGDLSKYTIRDVMQVLMQRFDDSAYAKKGQVGFLAWMRSGGNLLDVGGAVKVYQNSAT